MNKSKLWAVIGPGDGLGPAVIRYLLDRNQVVIAITCGETTMMADMPNLETARLIVTADTVHCPCLQRLTQKHGKIDILVDNYKSPAVLHFLLPYLSGEGRIIVAPPGTSQTISTYLCS